MEENEKQIDRLDLNQLQTKEGVLTIIHQDNPTPHLAKLHELEPVSLTGSIKAPANFFEKRTTEIKNDKSHVLYSYRERRITLITMEDFSELGSEVKGTLSVNPEWAAFGVNENKTFGIGELTKHIRMNKFLFDNKDQWAKIVAELQNFSGTVNAEIKRINDNKGNIEDVFKVTAKSNVTLNFNLKAPIFIGEEQKIVNVEIACQADNSQVKFWFESPDFMELLKKDSKNIIDIELKRFNTELVFIEQ